MITSKLIEAIKSTDPVAMTIAQKECIETLVVSYMIAVTSGLSTEREEEVIRRIDAMWDRLIVLEG